MVDRLSAIGVPKDLGDPVRLLPGNAADIHCAVIAQSPTATFRPLGSTTVTL